MQNDRPNDNTFDETAAKSVRPEVWSKVIVAAGKNPEAAELKFDDLMRLFRAEVPGSALLDALQTLHDLGHDAGQTAIERALEKSNFKFSQSDPPEGAAEEALYLWMAARSGTDKNALNLAHILCASRFKRLYKQLKGKHAATLTVTQSQIAQLLKVVEHYCREASISGDCEVRHSDIHGEAVFQVVRGSRTIVIPDRVGKSTKRVKLSPEKCDIIRYNHNTGTMSVSASTQLSLLSYYASHMGLIFFGDADYFSPNDIVNLRPFCDPQIMKDYYEFGIERLVVNTVLIDDVDGIVGFKAKGKEDCYRVMQRRNFSPAGCNFKKVVLRAWFVGAEDRRKRADISLETANNKASIPDDQYGHRIREFLRHVHVLGSRREKLEDPWVFLTGTLKLIDWRDQFAAIADQWARPGGLLINATPHGFPVNQDGDLAELHHLPGAVPGSAIAIANDAEGSARIVGPTDLDSLKLDLEAFVRLLTSELKLERTNGSHDSHQDLIHLGTRQLDGPGTGKLLSIYLSTKRPSSTPEAIERFIKGGPHGDRHVVLVPTDADASLFKGAEVIHWSLPSDKLSNLLRTIVKKLNWENDVHPTTWAPEDAHLVAKVSREKDGWARLAIWQKGNPLELAEAQKKALHALLLDHGNIVPVEQLGAGPHSTPGSVSTCITALRKALGLRRDHLKSVPNTGYILSRGAVFMV